MSADFWPHEQAELKQAQELIKQHKFAEARSILRQLPGNQQAKTLLAQLDTFLPDKTAVSAHQDYPTELDLNRIACSRCQRQIGKEVFECPNHQNETCEYQVTNQRYGSVGSGAVLLVVTVLFAVMTGFLLIGEARGGAILTLILALVTFKGFIDQAIGRRLRIENRRTGEIFQKLPGWGVMYAPTHNAPACIKNPPALKRPLSYPASLVALYDQRSVAVWQNPDDPDVDVMAYVFLATILQLVQRGVLHIGYIPSYSPASLRSNRLVRGVWGDYYLTFSPKTAKPEVQGWLENLIVKTIAKWPSSYSNYLKWYPGVPILHLLVELMPQRSSSGKRPNPTRTSRVRRKKILQELARDAKKYQLGQPNQKNSSLQQETAVLADLVTDFNEADPQLIRTIHNQLITQLHPNFTKKMLQVWLGQTETIHPTN